MRRELIGQEGGRNPVILTVYNDFKGWKGWGVYFSIRTPWAGACDRDSWLPNRVWRIRIGFGPIFGWLFFRYVHN